MQDGVEVEAPVDEQRFNLLYGFATPSRNPFHTLHEAARRASDVSPSGRDTSDSTTHAIRAPYGYHAGTELTR